MCSKCQGSEQLRRDAGDFRSSSIGKVIGVGPLVCGRVLRFRNREAVHRKEQRLAKNVPNALSKSRRMTIIRSNRRRDNEA